MSLRTKLFITMTVLVALAVGYSLGQKMTLMNQSSSTEGMAPTDASAGKGKILYYRNAMGLPDTSPVPKKDDMGMDYVPVYENDTQAEPATVSLSPERIQKLGVRTEVVGKHVLSRLVRAVGTVQIDETRQTIIAPRFEGWVGKLNVDAIGKQVKKGDPLFDCYSPQLIQIETEYLAFADADLGTGTKNGSLKRLRTLAVPEEEIARLQRKKKTNNTIILRAPRDGTILEKQAVEGMKFSSGDMLYRLSDLSHVWVLVDVYEQDLARIAVGQTAKISISALPGDVFMGTVSFISPTLNKETRTVKVRIELPNPKGVLRTDMYADVEVRTGEGSGVIAIPTSAVLNSGKAQIVLVERGDGLFQPHLVKIGAQVDGVVEVLDGVSEGDKIVTSANFLIDAESNLRAALQGFTQSETGGKP